MPRESPVGRETVPPLTGVSALIKLAHSSFAGSATVGTRSHQLQTRVLQRVPPAAIHRAGQNGARKTVNDAALFTTEMGMQMWTFISLSDFVPGDATDCTRYSGKARLHQLD